MANKKRVQNLVQTKNSWYVFYAQIKSWITDEDGNPYQPFLFGIVDQFSQTLVTAELLESEPTKAEIVEVLFNSMENPQNTKILPQRPNTIKFENKNLMEEISPDLSEIGVNTRFVPNPDLSRRILRGYEEFLESKTPQIEGLSKSFNQKPWRLAGFYRAAAEFYRAQPWVYLSDNDILQVKISSKDPYYLLIMGQAGMEYGVILFLKREDLESFYRSTASQNYKIPKSGWHALNFEEKQFLPVEDIEEIELHGFDIAAKNAYPMPMVYFGDGVSERPSQEIIIVYQMALQAVEQFVKFYFQGDGILSGKEKFEFQVRMGKDVEIVEVTYPVEGITRENNIPPIENISPMEMMDFQIDGKDDEELSKAQEIIQKAWESMDPKMRVKLAKKALKISPNCVNAYVILGNDLAGSNQEKYSYYQQGVDVGEEYFGAKYFKKNRGYFWGLLETRPYMRALSGTASCLWALGEKEKSIEVHKKMLELNPDDNQGIRYLLLDTLLTLKRYKEVEDLVMEYGESDEAVWSFTKALLKYIDAGDSLIANKLLKKALNQNVFVKAYLTGENRIPHDRPDYQGWGDESEAILYTVNHLNHWRIVPGAVDWLIKVSDD